MARTTSILNFLTGVPGVGKSWRAVWYLVNEVVPELAKTAYLYTNLPLNKQAFVDHFKDESLNKRIVLIDNEEMKSWRDSRKKPTFLRGSDYLSDYDSTVTVDLAQSETEMLGPWSYFADKECSGCVLILDEIHELCNRKDPAKYREEWENFLATIRHRGFKFSEFLTQDEAAVATEIKNRAGIKVCLEDNESQLDSLFKIPLYDWYNLIACYTGKYRKSFLELTYKKKSSRWDRKPMKEIRRYIDPFYFDFYDSFNHTSTTEEHGSKDKHIEQKPYQKLGFLKTHLWFLGRNFFNLSSRITILVLFIWMTLFGGMSKTVNFAVTKMVAFTNKTSEANSTKIDTIKRPEIKEEEMKEQEIEVVKNIEQDIIPDQQPNKTNQIPIETPEIALDIIVMISNDYIITNKGSVLKVGDTFNSSTILKIDYTKRGIYTDDEKFHTYSR